MSYFFSFTPQLVRSLQSLERPRAEILMTHMLPAVAEGLRLRARVRSTHFSTCIEGNRLTLVEAEQAVMEGRKFPGRERDTLEVQHYFQALAQIEKWVDEGKPVTEERIRQLHALIFTSKRARPTPYRDGQNVIRDGSGAIVYLPPEAGDVPVLMKEMVEWIRATENEQPVPVVAGLVHYQFVTIHPFFDGNGCTARALATWLLYRGGYDLGKFYALEEFYFQDLDGYYNALVTHPHHNYYFGRNQADITPWLAYFVKGMAVVFETVAREVREKAIQRDETSEALLRKLDRRARMVLGLFAHQEAITANDVANVLGLSPRQARDLLTEWINAGWLIVNDASRKSRAYSLAPDYRRFIGGITAVSSPKVYYPTTQGAPYRFSPNIHPAEINMKKVQTVLKQEDQMARKKLAQTPRKILSGYARKLLRKHVKQSRKAALRVAAAQMVETYQNDRELTALSVLDGEDFLITPAPK